jgi:hypothetical protein
VREVFLVAAAVVVSVGASQMTGIIFTAKTHISAVGKRLAFDK